MIGRLIDDRYQVRSRIARGGMATVYLATDLRLERRVAIKVMHGHLADDTTFKSRFVQEARSAAGLAHPNVVNVYDQGQDDDMAYLVMEYLPGITLRDLLKDYGKLTAEQTIDILDAVLGGLQAAHRAGIMHRDLKPENVLLADDGRIKLGDFGLARAASSNTTTGQALLGTIAYLSPELVTRGVADARSDVYALGIMTFEMLTGEQPFQGEQPMQIAYQHANDQVPAPSGLNPEVPPELDELVLWATARDPEQRPRDAGELRERLLALEGRGRPDETALLPTATTVLPEAGATTVLGTRTLNPADEVRPEAGATEAVATLARASRRRRGRGWILFVVVLLLAAFGAGTGWYFGAGPGAMVTVPDVAAKKPGAAEKALTDLGFATAQKKAYSQAVPDGVVIGSTPGAGEEVHKGDTVTLRVSAGRHPITIPALGGLAKDDATKALEKAGAKLGDVSSRFDEHAKAGTVLTATAAGSSGKDLTKGGHYLKGLAVDLLVSDGQVPDVVGKSYDDAAAALEAVGLKATQGAQSYSDQVPEGVVMSASFDHDGAVHKGDTMHLEISKGPAPVPVPDVTGKHLKEAKAALENDGFEVKYNKDWDKFPNGFTTVKSVSPKPGSSEPKGSTVTLELGLTVGG